MEYALDTRGSAPGMSALASFTGALSGRHVQVAWSAQVQCCFSWLGERPCTYFLVGATFQ